VLRETAPFKAALESQERAAADKRKASAAALTKLEIEAGATFAAFEAERPKVVAELEEARVAMLKASQRAAEYQAKRDGRAANNDRERGILEQQLIDTASPAIAAFVDAMHDAWTETLRRPPRRLESVKRNPNTGKIEHTVTVTGVTPAERAKAIRTVIEAAEALRLEADQSGVPAKLEALRKSIPDIGADA
jgi:hypothetical protein